ncbi:MAG: hypothetical protein EP338_14045 [Bacteroidetes bacterium]|nr:MAG: hypothetical protein EP338_14045 [Bacteroidota bacterium]
MRWKILSLGLLFWMTSCIRDSELKPVNPYDIVHDNTSKVWLLDHVYRKGVDQVPLSMGYKQIMIFHESRACYLHRIGEMGEKAGRKAHFKIDAEKERMYFEFKDESWEFQIEELDYERIRLKSVNDSVFPYAIELIPFPEY